MISLIVIEYHSLDDIKACIKAVKATCSDTELIVSSNSCYSKEKQEEILRAMPEARWSFNEQNGGFAYGMNQGLKIAKGDYLAIMNPDVKLQGSLSVLSRFLAEHSEVGAVAPQFVGYDGEIQDSCRSFVTPWRFFTRQIRRVFTRKVSVINSDFDYSKTQTVNCVIGAFIMVKREVYDKVGGLDDAYFMYAEDIDWCTRIWQAGYQVVYCPQVCMKYEGSRRARTDKKFAKIFILSHMKYWKKFGFIWGYPNTEHIVFD